MVAGLSRLSIQYLKTGRALLSAARGVGAPNKKYALHYGIGAVSGNRTRIISLEG